MTTPPESNGPPAGDEVMTTEEVAAFLRVSKKTVEKWRHEGVGPRRYKVGRHLRYLRSEVLAWVKTHEVTPETLDPE
jgi:excisionase family DNA binding protein